MKFSISRIEKLLRERIEQACMDELQGKAEGKNIQDVYNKYSDISQEDLSAEFEVGKKIEMEHTKEPEMAERITLDHLWESPTYYEDLKKCIERNGNEVIYERHRPLITGSDEFEEDESEEDVNTSEYERNIDNSDKLQSILGHEELVDLCKYVELVHKYPIATKLDTHCENSQTEAAYFIGKIDKDIIVKKKKLILKAGFYSIEHFLDTIPKIEPRVYTGSYETAEECIERLLDILIDLENRNADTSVSIKHDFDPEFT